MARTKNSSGWKTRLADARAWLADTDPDTKRSVTNIALWAGAAVVLAGVAVFGMRALQQRVLANRYQGARGQVRISLARKPAWMPDSLAARIAADLTPPEASLADSELAPRVYELAVANPWVMRVDRVQIQPQPDGGGVVRAELAYRRPVARVRIDLQYVYVDAAGHRLPMSQVPMYVITQRDGGGKMVRQFSYLSWGEVPAAWRPYARRIHYAVIDGVAAPPPSQGQLWASDDLHAGLQLVQLTYGRPYHCQISLIDVRNHRGRISTNQPELRMYAQVGRGRATDIRFGRFPAPTGGDYVISPQRKLSYLDEYVAARDGRLAGLNDYLDLRFEQLHVSVN